MPLVLAFTIKHHRKTSKINPVVPRTLQFHEDEDDCNNCDNISNEANDEMTENYEHPKFTVVERFMIMWKVQIIPMKIVMLMTIVNA